MANNFPNLLPSLNIDMVNGIYVDPRITFTRAGTRTYFGQEMVKAEENLLLRSQDYTATWTVTNLTPVTGKSAPDGTSTATEFTATAANAVLTQAITAVAGSYTFSVFLRRVTGTGDIQIAADNGTWTTKVITGTWARYDVTQTLTAGSKTAGIRVVTDTDAIEVWGAQLEFRSSLTAYTATTNQPITRYQRLLKTAAANEWPREFDPVTGECLGRSVWESRTNLLQRSEEFDNAYWTQVAVTVSPNQIIAPDGTLTVDKLISTAVSGFHNINRSSGTRVASTAYTYSFFAKAAEIGFCLPNFNSGLTGTTLGAVINLTTGAATSVSAGLTVRTVFVGNGFYRISITATGDANTTAFQATINTTDAAGNGSHTGDGTSGIYIWGAQLEAGAFATPYIPTVASQVTRVADSAVMTGVNFSSWFNPSEGAAFVEYAVGSVAGASKFALSFDGGANNYIELAASTTASKSKLDNRSSGSLDVAITSTANVNVGTANKAAFRYKSNDYALVLNGVVEGTDTVNVVPVVASLEIGRYNEGAPAGYLNGYIRRLTYYPQALTSANLQAITR